MKKHTIYAHIKSLNGEIKKVTLIKKYSILGIEIPDIYICKYKRIKFLVLFNRFNQEYYADDLYSIIKES